MRDLVPDHPSYETRFRQPGGRAGFPAEQLRRDADHGDWFNRESRLDRSQLSTAAWIDTQVGFEFRSPRDIATSANPVTRWQEWRTFQMIKYALKLTGPSTASSGAPGVTFDLTTTGGPALTPDLFYEFDWGDGTARGQFLGTHTGINHVYQADGPYTVEVFVKHPGLLDADGKYESHRGREAGYRPGRGVDPVRHFGHVGPHHHGAPGCSRSFAQSIGARGPSPFGSGLDAVFLRFDTGSEISVLLGLFVQAGAAFTAGETFSKVAAGVTVVAGQFNILLATDLNDPASPNSTQGEPGGTGTCTITSLAKLSDGTFVAHYSFSILNAAGRHDHRLRRRELEVGCSPSYEGSGGPAESGRTARRARRRDRIGRAPPAARCRGVRHRRSA